MNVCVCVCILHSIEIGSNMCSSLANFKKKHFKVLEVLLFDLSKSSLYNILHFKSLYATIYLLHLKCRRTIGHWQSGQTFEVKVRNKANIDV